MSECPNCLLVGKNVDENTPIKGSLKKDPVLPKTGGLFGRRAGGWVVEVVTARYSEPAAGDANGVCVRVPNNTNSKASKYPPGGGGGWEKKIRMRQVVCKKEVS